MRLDLMQSKFNKDYFRRYKKRGKFGLVYGEKPFWYGFWERYIRKHVIKRSVILEVGCGPGFFLKRIENDFVTYGLDVSESAILEAKERAPKSKLFTGTAESLPFNDGQIDCVIAFDVIEHLERPEAFLKEAARVLTKGGILIISTPNITSFGARVKGQKPELKGLPYEERYEESHIWRDETHISLKEKTEWAKLLEKHGFKVIRDGTDSLWDLPYFPQIPLSIQKLFFIPFNIALTWAFGFLRWEWGENIIFIAKRVEI